MDWPLTAVLTGMGAAVCAAGVYGVIWARSVPVPTAKAPAFTVALSPGVDPATFFKQPPQLDILPLQPLDPPPPPEPVATPEVPEPAAPKAKKSPAAPNPAAQKPAAQKTAPEPSSKAVPAPEQKKMASTDFRPAPKAPAAPPVEVEQWRVVTTSKASMFNLGGHVDKAGIVDGMATPHLKEALQKHKNFGRLPPAIKAHVNGAANIDLNRLAPYKSLLGMDQSLMEDQGVRFERVAHR